MNDSIKLLNLKDEDVEMIESVIENNTLYITLILRKKEETCPNCKSVDTIVDSYKPKEINHPMLSGMTCIIRYRCRRYCCKTCGKTFNEKNNFVSENKRSTNYECLNVLNLLKIPDNTFTSVARQCNISVTKVLYIFDSHINIPRKPLPTILSIDEYYNPPVGVGKYDCLLLDFDSNTVVDVLPDRSKYYLQKYFQGRTEAERNKVKFLSIDMWEPYKDVAKLYLKNAKVCVDAFHVIKNINNALDSVRIRVMNSYDEKSSQYYLLKKFKFLLSYNFYNIPKREAKYNHRLDKTLNYIDILNLILNTSEELKTAYFLKENYVEFNGKSTLENAEANLNVLLDNILSKNIPEFNKVYSMLKHWKVEIVNSFNLSKDGRRINNSVIEGRNSTIKKIIRNANGVKNFQRIRNRIMYCLNNEAFSIEENKENNIKQKGNKRGKYNKNN